MADIVDQVARTEIRALRGEFHEFSITQRAQGEVLTEIRSDLKNNKPTGFFEIIKGGITLAVFVASLVGGIAYVVNAMSESRLTLIEYKIQQAEKQIGWAPTLHK